MKPFMALLALDPLSTTTVVTETLLTSFTWLNITILHFSFTFQRLLIDVTALLRRGSSFALRVCVSLFPFCIILQSF